MRNSPRLAAARTLVTLSVVGIAALLGSPVEADSPESPTMPAPTPTVATKDVPAKPLMDLSAPKTVATATFAVG